MTRKKAFRSALRILLILFLIMNGTAFMHAYKFTHFSTEVSAKTSEKLSFGQKLKLAFTGVNNPKPRNHALPNHPYQVVRLSSNKRIEGWLITKDSAKGTVLLCHGYGGEKSGMLDKAEEFWRMGYSTMLIDFMGAGASEGVQTTIGCKEATEVRDCVAYLKQKGEKNIILFGTSMGAAAIMRAVGELQVRPQSIIIECPFSTMYRTVCNRFHTQGVPVFPMAGMLLFWGSVQNGFWAFGHNPVSYAQNIHCPTLLLYGEKDEKVGRDEIDAIYATLKGQKMLRTYPLAGHENYLHKYRNAWVNDMQTFLNNPSNLNWQACLNPTLNSKLQT